MARIPDAESASVDQSKITDYLLAESHPDGRSKAAFLKRFGFNVENWGVLAAALRQIARQNEVVEAIESNYGTRYIVDGVLESPDGRAPVLRTVWIVERGRPAPRFITGYPV
jgi:hypothetical protein